MTTPLILLVLMTAPDLIVKAYVSATKESSDGRNAAAVGAGLLFAFTGTGHFVETESMLQMLPPWVPCRTWLIYATGLLEFAIAAGFFVPKTRRATGWIAIGLLVLFFPVNVYAAINHVGVGGHAWGRLGADVSTDPDSAARHHFVVGLLVHCPSDKNRPHQSRCGLNFA
jgi:uncharacterized membrane protein